MKSTPIVVTGLARCGSSLVMQMLEAAGVKCYGTAPYFWPANKTRTKEEVEAMSDGAFKHIDPEDHKLPEGLKYRFIFLTRSRRQQTLSQLKMMRLLGVLNGTIGDLEIEQYEDSLRIAADKAFQIISGHEGSILKVAFEDLISRPASTVNRIAWFLGLETEDAMQGCVKLRHATCYPGMLEAEVLTNLTPPTENQ